MDFRKIGGIDEMSWLNVGSLGLRLRVRDRVGSE